MIKSCSPIEPDSECWHASSHEVSGCILIGVGKNKYTSIPVKYNAKLPLRVRVWFKS